MAYIPVTLRRVVIQRADNHCEYCGLAQVSQIATFHIDHVVPVAAGGQTSESNLALACVSCSLRKAARLTVFDPETGLEAPFFNPRTDRWSDHFQWEGTFAVGISAVGRAAVEVLALNRPAVLLIREEEAQRGRHPYP